MAPPPTLLGHHDAPSPRRRPRPSRPNGRPGRPGDQPEPAKLMSRTWTRDAVRIIEADFNRSADTHLIPLPLPALPGVHVYLKDESSHPTGSLKHRLARSLFLYALANGWIREGTHDRRGLAAARRPSPRPTSRACSACRSWR
ncbi:MAG: hypothetical protein MZW92_26150 [Comamonadaceae bacterium]|nr:hypothetical protein [Comamonadaceae bacterium]